MRSQKVQNKSQNKLYFCTLCGFIASSSSELDHHIRMVHEDYEDEISEIEFENVRKVTEYEAYVETCKAGACIIRKQIDLEDDKSKVRQLYKDYCLTCVAHKYLFAELKKEGKI